MIDLPVALTLGPRWREPKDKGPRFRRTRQVAFAVRRFAREWHRGSSEEWRIHFERPFSGPEHTP
jgi:hypothetical protein